ncbi:hypothetical protein GCM10011313_11550 [Mycetocola zhadangensis]|nr:hypothetical protein GCM10011313_11550 [Mycetocola zhadangensis]
MSEQIREVAFKVSDRISRCEAAAENSAEFGSTLISRPFEIGSSGTTAISGAGSSLSAAPLSMVLDRASNQELEALLRDAARAKSELDVVIAAGAGVVAKRSTRDLGYSGWAQW